MASQNPHKTPLFTVCCCWILYNDFLQSSRISDSDKLNRDLLIYLLWSTGLYDNQEIGNLFGLGYSSISRRVTIMKSKMSGEDEMNKRLEKIKSLIKV